ncbi:MAG: hypothetical protein QXF26_07025 [Candidatus Bathyarchaeia archaeon]
MAEEGLSGDLLQRIKLHGLRSGLWHRLRPVERSLFQASIVYARLKGMIVNNHLLRLLGGIVEKLRACVRGGIVLLGRSRAISLWSLFACRGVFSWCPTLRRWLGDEGYVFYLGVTWMNTGALFRSP